MRIPLTLAVSVGCLTVAVVAAQYAVGQQQAPTENKGVSVKSFGVIDLGPEIDCMGGRQLRLREATIAPGGMFAVHNHKDRPTVEFIMRGTATEFRGSESKQIQEGGAVLSDKNTTHWWRNDGNVPAVFVVADIYNAPK